MPARRSGIALAVEVEEEEEAAEGGVTRKLLKRWVVARRENLDGFGGESGRAGLRIDLGAAGRGAVEVWRGRSGSVYRGVEEGSLLSLVAFCSLYSSFVFRCSLLTLLVHRDPLALVICSGLFLVLILAYSPC